MKNSVYLISNQSLLVALLPMVVVIVLSWRWSLKPWKIIYATGRMLLQLCLIGFVLTFIFQSNYFWPLAIILIVMMVVASWIAVQSIERKGWNIYLKVFVSLSTVGLSILALVIFVIIRPTPWYLPTYVIPLAGMIFSNSMNTISICAERFFKESSDGQTYEKARNVAWKTSLIPLTNMFLAVGLVSLPGMMTGQILAGVDPLVAVRYQILILSCLYGSAATSSALFLSFFRPK